MENERKIPGAYTCKSCSRSFPMIVENHYIAIDSEKTGFSAIVGGESNLYDAFDCPYCGCQNVIGTRKRVLVDNTATVTVTKYEEEYSEENQDDEEDD
jgi:hypothetical protein